MTPAKKRLLATLLPQLQQASTWRGLIMTLTSLGVAIQPQHVALIVSFGTGLAGLVGVFVSDAPNE